MINNKILLVLLFFASINAMNDNHQQDSIIRIAPSIENARQLVWSHTENYLDPIGLSYIDVLNGEIDEPVIPYSTSQIGTKYYAHQYADDNFSWKVIVAYGGAVQDIEIVLPFRPIHLALNKTKSILLIEGPWKLNSRANHNVLVAYALQTNKRYHLTGYKAKNGNKTSFIGFKGKVDVPIAVAEFDELTRQEWDLSVIEQ